MFRSTQPPTLTGMEEMSSTLRVTGRRPNVADWGGGMSAGCKPRVQLYAGVGNGWPHDALR